jgi:hypothetical protein
MHRLAFQWDVLYRCWSDGRPDVIAHVKGHQQCIRIDWVRPISGYSQ